MDKHHVLILVLATTASWTSCVLGQRVYERGQQPEANFQERAYLSDDYYEDYSQPQSAAPVVPVSRTQPADSGSRGRLPSNSLNQFYQTDNCKSRERTLPHEKYCDHFYQLNGCSGSDDQAILRACPNGLVYTGNGRQGLIGVCDYPHRADCNGRERHNPPISTDHCDWLYGIFGHETSCTRYWTCWNGTATEQFCIGGLLYNEETHACDWPQNVGGCQKHPLCKDDPNGNVPLGKSCNRYWACQGGYPRLQRCPAMLVFDKDRKRCVSPPTADCDVPVTTPSPEDEESDSPSGPRGRPQPQQQAIPENRRRFQLPDQGGPGQGLPFELPSGATLLQRPPQ